MCATTLAFRFIIIYYNILLDMLCIYKVNLVNSRLRVIKMSSFPPDKIIEKV